MNIKPVRVALAELLGPALDCDPALPSMPATLMPGALYIRPRSGADYVTWEGGNFCRMVVNLSAVVVGSTADIVQAQEWIDERVSRVQGVLGSNNTLGGLTQATWVESVSEPQLVSTSTGEFLSVELRFHPIRIIN